MSENSAIFLDEILEFVSKKGITAYKIAQNTSLSDVGVKKILDKKSTRPNSLTIREIANYLYEEFGFEPNKSSDFINVPHHGSHTSDVPTEEDLLSLINKIEDSELRSSINTGVQKLYKEIERLKNTMSSALNILDGKK